MISLLAVSAFEPIAREEVNSEIPEQRIEKRIRFGFRHFWKISMFRECIIYAVFTDVKKLEMENSSYLKPFFETAYLELLKEYDVVRSSKRNLFSMRINDSKH